jgi:hypothetical protein
MEQLDNSFKKYFLINFIYNEIYSQFFLKIKGHLK